jgi:retron-type reverse transcriptase
VKRHHDLWERVCSFDNIAAAAREAMRGKRGKAAGARFFGHWEQEVVRLERELREGSYRPGSYFYFEITDPKRRVVAAAPFRDRVVHHALVRVIEPLFEPRFIEDSYACRTGKGTHAGMRRALEFARRFPWAVKCDIRRYFPSIDHRILQGQIARVVADRAVLALIDLILASHVEQTETRWPAGGDLFAAVNCPQGLPIGNLTSQFFANIYLDGFDHFVKQTLRAKGYVRYVDDFLLYGGNRAEVRDRGEAAREYLRGLRLEIHPDKYRSVRCAQGVDFCGFVVRADGRVKVRESGVRRFKRRHRKLRWEAKLGRVPMADVTRSVRAWVAHAEHAQSWHLRAAVLSH